MKDQVRHGITYSLTFQEYQACVAARLDYWSWETGVYPPKFKARVMAGYELSQLVEAHVEDARADKMKAQSRTRSRRR